MTKERAKELLPVMQAFAEGKTVEYRQKGAMGWSVVRNPEWNDDTEYRVQPEPKTRPMTRGEILYMVTTTPGMVVRFEGEAPSPGQCWAYSGANIPKYEWAIIDKSGNPIDGWHKFEVTE